jgi:ferredoxin
MKVVLEKEKCIGCGTCVTLCPKYFEMGKDDRASLKGGVSSGETEQLTISNIECIKDAADSCSGQAINIE